MKITNFVRQANFRGDELDYATAAYYCETCGFEAGTTEQAGAEQKAMGNAYRQARGLLTSEEIKSMRAQADLTQQQLVDKVGACVTSKCVNQDPLEN